MNMTDLRMKVSSSSLNCKSHMPQQFVPLLTCVIPFPTLFTYIPRELQSAMIVAASCFCSLEFSLREHPNLTEPASVG